MSTLTMSQVIKVAILLATTMAMIIALSSMTVNYNNPSHNIGDHEESSTPRLLLPSKRVSRFLAQNDNYGSARNPKAADHCKKDNEICAQLAYGTNSTCCNNKCMDLNEDDKNCGACKNKCKYTQHCCRGKCVDLSYDKNHCGSCNNKCLTWQYCIYGLCDYA
ncbi:stigma-specific STIG1-like protein 3 [Silene latifolia]|uniref:stigma-specific STIG1-like protein 3 n=1 Tax=Silene latifolia TaxID=37657 RepID=UPI003D77B00B